LAHDRAARTTRRRPGHAAARGHATLLAGALWAKHRSQEVIAAQLAEHPELAMTPTTFADSAYEAIRLLLRGATAG
jgi:hypothetical protein